MDIIVIFNPRKNKDEVVIIKSYLDNSVEEKTNIDKKYSTCK